LPTRLTIPTPPSVNMAYRNNRPQDKGKGRHKTERVLDWEREALWRIRAQRPPRVAGPVCVIMSFERGSPLADADNRIKLTKDVLVKSGVIDDDKHAIGGAYSWAPKGSGMAYITIFSISEPIALRFMPLPEEGRDEPRSGIWIPTDTEDDIGFDSITTEEDG